MKHLFTLLFLFLITFSFGQISVYDKEVSVSESVMVNIKKPKEKDVLWMSPNSHLNGNQFERVELAVDLPKEIQAKVAHFLDTDDSINGINPFLEWQLDITAEFQNEVTGTTKTIDAFYYSDFERDTSSADFRRWRWIAQETPLNMRVRFAPPEGGNWRCKVNVTTKDTSFNYTPFTFNVTRSNNPGYITIGESKRFFQAGEETYFPAGQNLVSPRCEFCFANSAKQLPNERTGDAKQSLESWMLEPTVMKGFIMFQDHMKSLSANGGNYFRELLLPQNQDIEWEKLGNYYDRMNRAWELDEQIFLAEQLDLKIQLNVQIQFALEVGTSRTFWNWSVDPSDKRHYSAATPCANPYNRQIKTTKNDAPNTFFSDLTAKKFYKQKLRYIMSRWGYSTNLAVIGMASEIESTCTEPAICTSWMKEMGDYLKNDLEINQLLSPSFLGIYHNALEYEHPIMAMEAYEMSTLNWYSASSSKFQGAGRDIKKYNELFDQPFFYGEIGNADLYPCDTARIEWVRDAWFSSFSGNAGTGLNWDDPFDDELRVCLGNIHTFVEGIDFDGEKENEYWESYRILSDNRKAETIFLMSPDKSAAVGVISNRYYNWYIYGDTTVTKGGVSLCSGRVPNDPGFDGSKAPAEKGVWEREYADNPINYIDRVSGKTKMNDAVVYTPFEAFDYTTSKNYRLRIYGLQRASYTVDFFNALTMEYLGSRSNWGPNVKLEYPEMNLESGLIAFKLRINKSDEFPQVKAENRIAVDYQNAEYNETAKLLTIQNNRYSIKVNKDNNNCTIEILDNPTDKVFEIKLYNQSKEIVVIKSFDTYDYNFELPSLSKGIYQIKLEINGVPYYETLRI